MTASEPTGFDKALLLHRLFAHYNSVARSSNFSQRQNSGSRKGTNLEFWKEVFRRMGIETDERKVIRYLFLLQDFSKSLYEEYQMIPNENHELYLKHARGFEHRFECLNMGSQWTKGEISEIQMHSLMLLSERFKFAGVQEPNIGKATIKEIHENIEALITSLKSSDLPPELTSLFLSQMRIIQEALDHYEVMGGSDLTGQLEQIIGKAYFFRELLENNKENNEVKEAESIIKKFSNIVDNAHKCVGYFKSIEYTFNMIGFG